MRCSQSIVVSDDDGNENGNGDDNCDDGDDNCDDNDGNDDDDDYDDTKTTTDRKEGMYRDEHTHKKNFSINTFLIILVLYC